MPAILTHHFFGKSVLNEVSTIVEFKSKEEIDAFILGNQGPDPFFYLVLGKRYKASKPLGSVMHKARPAQLLFNLCSLTKDAESESSQIARAYVSGFLCHWALDSTLHPLVYYWQNALIGAGVVGLDASSSDKVHGEIERDIDEAVLYSRTGRTIDSYKPYKEILNCSRDALKTIDSLYEGASIMTYGLPVRNDSFSAAVFGFRHIQRLFYSPGATKRGLCSAIEVLFTRDDYSLYNAMSHRRRAEAFSIFDNREHDDWINPFTNEKSSDSFEDLFNKAKDLAVDAVKKLVVSTCTLNVCEEVTKNLNFEGEYSEIDGDFEWC